MNTTFPRLNPGRTGLLALTLAFVATEAGAQSLSLDFGDGGGRSAAAAVCWTGWKS